MINTGIAIVYVLGITLVGYCVQSLIVKDTVSILEKLGISYGIGVGLLAFQLFIYSLLGIGWNSVVVILPWIIVVVWAYTKGAFYKNYFAFVEKPSKINLLLAILILLLLIFVGIEAVNKPVSAWDGWSIWLMKAKLFYIDQAIKPFIFSYTNSDYPIVVSLVASFFYKIVGIVDDRSVLFIFYFFYVSLGVAFFAFLKQRTTLTVSLLGTFLLLSLQNMMRQGGRYDIGNVDIALAYYFFVDIYLLLAFFKIKKISICLLLCFLLGVTSLIKYEGIPFSAIVASFLAFDILKANKKEYLLSFFLWITPIAAWYLYKQFNHLPKTYIQAGGLEIGRFSVIAIDMLKEFLNISRWNGMWIVYAISMFITKNKTVLLINSILFLQLAVYFGAYMVSPIPPSIQVGNSFDRLLLQICPLACASVILTVYSFFKIHD